MVDPRISAFADCALAVFLQIRIFSEIYYLESDYKEVVSSLEIDYKQVNANPLTMVWEWIHMKLMNMRVRWPHENHETDTV